MNRAKKPSRQRERVRNWQQHLTTGVLHARVVVNPNEPFFDRILQAVDIVNGAQSFYRLHVDEDVRGRFLPAGRSFRSGHRLRTRLMQAHPHDLIIAMVATDLDGGLTIDEAPGCTLISCDDWDGENDAPSLRIDLVYQLTSALISFAACLTVDENEELMHGDREGGQRGCLFDFWTNIAHLRLIMACAWLCDSCRRSLRMHGAPEEALASTERLLDWVRAAIIGRERPLPRKIFLGHGRSKDWLQLKAILTEWNLPVIEFNEVPAAGVSTTQRLKSMLEESRFAFLVMTAEDRDDRGHLQARMNVVHEIGLFQGRLGPEHAVVLRESKTTVFSNLDGLNRLEYKPGRLGDLRGEIHRLLVSRGVLAADIGRPAETLDG